MLVTHHHADHSSGIDALRARWPRSTRASGCRPASAAGAGLSDNERVRAGDRDVIVIHTQGHAPDHVCFWDPVERACYSGDMLAIGTTVMIPAGRGGNLRQYLASLERMAALDPRIAFPGHGPAIERPIDLIRQGTLSIARCASHRFSRRFRTTCVDVDLIVTRIYGELVDPVRRAARETVHRAFGKAARRRRHRVKPNLRRLPPRGQRLRPRRHAFRLRQRVADDSLELFEIGDEAPASLGRQPHERLRPAPLESLPHFDQSAPRAARRGGG